ncbi:hypothetical protein GF312_20560 [Candidatus Poribacteria bacterium]|nr:hypothetical protein [Candidatus Poribacteria bacterium]
MELNNAEKAVYDTDCINLIDSDDKQLPLFNRINSLDDLKQLNIIHQWYDYLENFPFSLLEESIEKYNLSPENLIFDPFCGSGTTLVSGKLSGLEAIGVDANPLMCPVSGKKIVWIVQKYFYDDMKKRFALKELDFNPDSSNYFLVFNIDISCPDKYEIVLQESHSSTINNLLKAFQNIDIPKVNNFIRKLHTKLRLNLGVEI